MESKQGRFGEAQGVWSSFVELGRTLHERAQPKANDVQGLDAWMQEVLRCDPVLPGMIAKLTSSFAGQGWKIIGPARAASRAAFVLENAQGGAGLVPLCRDVRQELPDAQPGLLRRGGASV